jgi:hypothetical protein
MRPSFGSVMRLMTLSSVDSAVAADDADHLAARDVERNVLQRPEIFHRGVRTLRRSRAEDAACLLCDHVPQGDIAVALMANAVLLAETVDADRGAGHSLHPHPVAAPQLFR